MACCGTTTTTSSCNQCGNTCGSRRGGNGFLLVIVLYILLAIIVGSFVYLVICYLQSCYEIQKVYDSYNQLKQNYNEILTEDDLHEIFGNDEILITMKKTISKSKKIYLGIWILFLIGALIVVEYLSSSPNTQYIIDFIKKVYMSVCMNNKA